MTVVSDSSPLITLARIDCLHFLPQLFGRIVIPQEVYDEVVIRGAGLPGAIQTAGADWIEVGRVRNTELLSGLIARKKLGAGELRAVVLAKEIDAGLVLMDERRTRRYARDLGLVVMGCVGILEHLYEEGRLDDLASAYRKLLHHNIRIDRPTLQYSLAKFQLPELF